VTLDVYDLQGRHRATVFDGFLPAGRHERKWSGETSDGAVGPGVYFYRLRAGGETRTVRGVRME
jgi:hypothetical protein